MKESKGRKATRISVVIVLVLCIFLLASAASAAGVAVLVADIYPGASSSLISGSTVYNGELYFRADGNDGNGLELWKYNSTTDTASLVVDIYAGATGSNPIYPAVYNGELYFRANGNDGNGNELWKYNSGTNTASLVANIRPALASSAPYYLTVYDGELYFRANGGDGAGEELWKYNSGTDTASRVFDLNPGTPGSQPSYLAVYNGDLYFRADDGSGIGEELWKYNSTTDTASLVADINSTGSSSLFYLTVYNGELYFAADDGTGVSGVELWKYNSTTDTASLAADVRLGAGSSFPGYFAVFNGELYFQANGGGGAAEGTELWKYNSTTGVAELVLDINAGTASSSPMDLAVYDNELYFRADGGDGSGSELWKYHADLDYPLVVSTSLNPSYANGPSAFTVTFSEDVDDPAGNAGTDDVTNPANYLLVEEGAAAGFNTLSCLSGFDANDTLVTVDNVSYDSGTFTASVSINGGASLPDGTYRLFVCGTTSIVDLVGNPLAGDGQTPGTDYTFDFTVQAGVSPTPRALPETGFAQGVVTRLPAQPAARSYTSSELTLEIPSLGVTMPIVGVPQHGGSWDVTWLGNNAGYLYGSAFPTWAGNTIITGHVWNADNTPGPFAQIKTLRYGDLVEIHAWGLVYTYEVRDSRLLWANQVSAVFEHQEYDWVTLLTCETYRMQYGEYMFRRAVQAVLVSVIPE